MATLQRLPALRVLERLPVPVVAVTDEGTILFANDALAGLLGYPRDALQSMKFSEIFKATAETDGTVSFIHGHADSLVGLLHADGGTVRALMSRSALQRADDVIALVTFQDLSEQLWLQGR